MNNWHVPNPVPGLCNGPSPASPASPAWLRIRQDPIYLVGKPHRACDNVCVCVCVVRESQKIGLQNVRSLMPFGKPLREPPWNLLDVPNATFYRVRDEQASYHARVQSVYQSA